MSLGPALRRAAGALLATLLAPPLTALGMGPGALDCPPPPPSPAALQAVVGATAPRDGPQGPDRGLLWRVTRDGRTSWLYATLHVGRAEWRPGPLVLEALRTSDVVAFELDVLDPDLGPALTEAVRARSTTAFELPSALQARLAAAARRACADDESLAGLHPAWQVLQLTVAEARRDGLEPLYAQEIVLGLLARRLQRPVLPLETVHEQLDALLPPDPAALAAEVDHALRLLEDGRARPALRRIVQAWIEGDLATLSDPAAWCDCVPTEADRAALVRLNDRRNVHLAERFDGLHREGRRVFAAVGALHMTGPQGLPSLLARRGYRVDPWWPPGAPDASAGPPRPRTPSAPP